MGAKLLAKMKNSNPKSNCAKLAIHHSCILILKPHSKYTELLVPGDTLHSDLRSTVGRRLADGLSNSGDLGTDREDSPLQSKRSSRFFFGFDSVVVHALLTVSFPFI